VVSQLRPLSRRSSFGQTFGIALLLTIQLDGILETKDLPCTQIRLFLCHKAKINKFTVYITTTLHLTHCQNTYKAIVYILSLGSVLLALLNGGTTTPMACN